MVLTKMFKKIIISIISILTITVGVLWVKEKNEEKQKIEIAQTEVESYIRKNYKNIESIAFIDYRFNPMNGVFVDGYLNNNKEKEFSVTYNFSTHSITSSVVDAEEKEECLDKVCE